MTISRAIPEKLYEVQMAGIDGVCDDCLHLTIDSILEDGKFEKEEEYISNAVGALLLLVTSTLTSFEFQLWAIFFPQFLLCAGFDRSQLCAEFRTRRLCAFAGSAVFPQWRKYEFGVSSIAMVIVILNASHVSGSISGVSWMVRMIGMQHNLDDRELQHNLLFAIDNSLTACYFLRIHRLSMCMDKAYHRLRRFKLGPALSSRIENRSSMLDGIMDMQELSILKLSVTPVAACTFSPFTGG
ncbi:hypothetical protein C8R44DRAFT_752343 [Mycena epipterygia]|nr:hypothetical protein C8R44DRAFT_752343 [Mycena epipterygia]